ncbi:hypothetical protein ACHHYP_00469 [Achlya hypogyna]|uniref:DRBM domain-containing protein n=1 Tax=Achlya hypogyna TaxID=1202772 RepID=A0A1V9ZAP2_ACHHY|nr:hypothetical protein ACHHYP_00469 [Achlya hypogyna]
MSKRPLDNDDAAADETAFECTTYSDKPLPSGWKKVVHRSGLACFLHEASGVVTWTKPYVATADSATSLEAAVAMHVPPLEIFAEGCGMRNPDRNQPVKRIQADAIIRRMNRLLPAESEGDTTEQVPSKKVKREPTGSPSPPKHPTAADTRGKIVVNGVTFEDPTGKTAMAFLLDYAKNWVNAIPEYQQTNADDGGLPFRCTVSIAGKEYGSAGGVTKLVARQGAAEAALATLLPDYWNTFKKSGLLREVDIMGVEMTKAPTIDMARFKELSITDPLVLQACMDLSIKTPAQLLAEFQTRNKGTAVNYTTVNLAYTNDRNNFKVVASNGQHAAEAVAPNKKLAKQYAAQALLHVLHPTITTYFDMVEFHENCVLKGSGAKPKPGLLGAVGPVKSGTTKFARYGGTHGAKSYNGDPAASRPANPFTRPDDIHGGRSLPSAQPRLHGSTGSQHAPRARFEYKDSSPLYERTFNSAPPSYTPPSSYRYQNDYNQEKDYYNTSDGTFYGEVKREPAYYPSAPQEGYSRSYEYRPQWEASPPAQYQYTAPHNSQPALLPAPTQAARHRQPPSGGYSKPNPIHQLKSELRKSLKY